MVLPSETLLAFHVSAVTISPKELARLQTVTPRNANVYEPVESYPVVVRRHYHGDEDEGDDDDEHEEHHYRRRYPERIEVIFISDHRAKVGICWPERTDYVFLPGDYVDEILEPISESRTGSEEMVG